MTSNIHKDRSKIIDQFIEKPNVSVLVIGGGVNGIGVFRDLAMQGVSVLLVEKNDFCSGASGASSHMAHGGIRYLENGEFDLVKEALAERDLLLNNAPHYVKPLPTVIPIFKWFSGIWNAPLKFFGLLSKPSERGLVVIKIGLLFYDLFSRKLTSLPKHSILTRKKSLALYPKLDRKIIRTALYYDGAIYYPERLCIEMILDAENANPEAKAVNYMEVVSQNEDSILIHDQETNREFRIIPKIVINASGAWTDNVNKDLGNATRYISGTKGSHIVLDNTELREAVGDNEFFFENDDGRIVLIFPYFNRVLVGTSDIYIDDPDDAYCSDEEIDYFIKMIKNVFPDIPVDKKQVIFKYSGVRPLQAQTTRQAAQVTRNHDIKIDEPSQNNKFLTLSLVGGKWTTFRSFAEQATNLCLQRLSTERRIATRNMAIGGGKNYPKNKPETEILYEKFSKNSNLSWEQFSVLFERYGTNFIEFIAKTENEIDDRLVNLPEYTQTEIVSLITREKVVHLDDLLIRRSLLAALGYISQDSMLEIASIFEVALELSEAEMAVELQRLSKILKEKHGVNF